MKKKPPRPIPNLGKRLYRARKAASEPGGEVTQGEAGQMVGKKGQVVGRWEKGKHEPALMDLVGLAKLYGVDLAELTFGSPEERAALLAEYKPPPEPIKEPSP